MKGLVATVRNLGLSLSAMENYWGFKMEERHDRFEFLKDRFDIVWDGLGLGRLQPERLMQESRWEMMWLGQRFEEQMQEEVVGIRKQFQGRAEDLASGLDMGIEGKRGIEHDS